MCGSTAPKSEAELLVTVVFEFTCTLNAMGRVGDRLEPCFGDLSRAFGAETIKAALDTFKSTFDLGQRFAFAVHQQNRVVLLVGIASHVSDVAGNGR